MFSRPGTTVLYSSDGRLLNARTSEDGQWRFPHNKNVPEKFAISIVMFEDKYFYAHKGINPISLIRAFWQNIKSGKIASGGSTLSMQVIRLHRQGKPRTIKEKIIEIILATRLELKNSKKEILSMYSSNAPFGGNVVGLDAACWRYFDIPPENISWGQAATLAVLPNSPALVHPGRNREVLLEKRNSLLENLYKASYLDSMDFILAKAESLPGRPHPLPQHAPHLFERSRNEGFDGMNIVSTLDYDLQLRVNKIAYEHHLKQRQNHVNNIAILVVDTKNGNVLSYTGNKYDIKNPTYGMHVDIITSLRSPGSLLKPFLYAAMLSEGYILPNSLIADVPTNFKGFAPENFNRSYDGAVHASRALSRSLNVPAVKMLQNYSVEKFLDMLNELGFTTFTKPASHYGLSIILGGAEVTMWEITGIYASLGRLLAEYKSGKNFEHEIFKELNYIKGENIKTYQENFHNPPLSPGSAYHTINSLKEVNRPEEEIFWREFESQFPVAWKTGTSYGNRDAWAIGITPEYTVGVWIGNASGEGRPELTGINTAAPAMFDVFKVLMPKKWFNPPYDDMEHIVICRHSGHRAGQNCILTDTLWVQKEGLTTLPCQYHQIVHLDKAEKYRVNTSCENLNNIVTKSWFILPPVQEFYFRQKNPFYKHLPPYRSDCTTQGQKQRNIELIYPPDNARLFIPFEIDGRKGEVVFKLAHRNESSEVYWHINNNYIETTTAFHEISVRPSAGHHILTVVDESGEMISRKFEIITSR